MINSSEDFEAVILTNNLCFNSMGPAQDEAELLHMEF